jgi:hypothetical protein
MVQHHGGCIFEINPPELNIQTFSVWNFPISEISTAILLIQFYNENWARNFNRIEIRVDSDAFLNRLKLQ